MNKLTIIGNLVRDPELRTTSGGDAVATFTVAVNRRGQNLDPDYFRVTAWRTVGENCARFLSKGKKVCIIGPVKLSEYKDKNGNDRALMEVTAEDVEFLSPKGDTKETKKKEEPVVIADEDDELPF